MIGPLHVHSETPGIASPYLYSETHPQRCVGCDRRASVPLCRQCFDALPRIGSPTCARCGLPTAFETFVGDECEGVDFGFESARAPLRYTGVGKEIVHTLKYGGYTRVVERLAAPLMLDRRHSPLRRRRAGPPAPLAPQAQGLQPGGAPRARRRGENKRTCFRYTTSRAQDAGSGRALGRGEEGQRRGRLQGQGRRPGKGTPDRRRLHDRSDDERVRRDPPGDRSERGARPEPVQNVLAISKKAESLWLTAAH